MNTNSTYALMGITGQVGAAAARALLQAGQRVRGIVRDPARAAAWANEGVELAVADSRDAAALEAAFRDTEGVFVMIPPDFAPAAGFPETRVIVAALRQALAAARPPKVVYLSSIGAQHPSGLGVIAQLHLLETELGPLPIPQAFVRAAWFLENFRGDVASARERGEIAAFLSPLDRAFPMVATEDVGRLVAKTLRENWEGNRHLELEGPRGYSMRDAAAAFAALLGRPVQARAVPRDRWQARFEQQGTPADRTGGRIEMLEGFNSGWIDFENGAGNTEHILGEVTMEEAFRAFLAPSDPPRSTPVAGSTEVVMDVLGAQMRVVARMGEADEHTVLIRSQMGAEPRAVPLHAHADVEGFYVLAGQLEVYLDSDGESPGWRALGPGQGLTVAGHVKHAVRNVSGAPVDSIVATTVRLARFLRNIARPPGVHGAPTAGEAARVRQRAADYGYWLASPAENAGISGRPLLPLTEELPRG